MTTVTYDTVTLSEPNLGPRDHSPVCNVTELHEGGQSLQGHARKVRRWEVTCLTEDEAEITALEDLMGQRLNLTVNGVVYGSVMICQPFIDTLVSPGWWTYTIGFVQEILS